MAMQATSTYSIPGASIIAPSDLRLMTPFILTEQQDWFETEIHFIRRFLRPGMRVVDVGANYGCYTLTSAQLVGPTGSVHAYEPASLPGECLARSVAANGFSQVTIHRMALSDHVGSAVLGIDDNAELNSLSNIRGAGEMVPLGTLATEQPGWGGPVDFLKLDAEGEEVRILAAAGDVLRSADAPLVMFEYKHGANVNHGLINAIRDHGMDIWRLVPGLQALAPLDTSRPVDAFLLNIFGCSAGRAARLHDQGLLVIDHSRHIPPIAPDAAASLVNDWWRSHGWSELFHMPASAAAPASDDYLCGIAHLLLSEQEGIPIDDRHAHLVYSTDLLEKATMRHPGVARWLSLSRATMAIGRRDHAVQCLQRLDRRLTTCRFDDLPIEEPFLPPERMHDRIALNGGDRGDLLQCCIDEALLRRFSFSLYFANDGIRPLIERMRQNPRLDPASRQRISAWDASGRAATDRCRAMPSDSSCR